MSCQDTEDVRIIVKYSSFPGETPTIPNSANHEDGTWLPTDLYVGEMFINAFDNKAWVRGIGGIFPLGATGGTVSFIGDFVPASTGGTFSGPVTTTTLTTGTVSAVSITASNIFGDVITASYFIGDGSGLTNIQSTWNGGTVSNPVAFLGDTDHYGFTNFYGELQGDNGVIDVNSNIDASGFGISASYFYGDGSFLTNLPVGTYSDIYTISATLSGNQILFNRNDFAPAYSVDLTPILATDSIVSVLWDSPASSLVITYGSGYEVSTIIDTFTNFSAQNLTVNNAYGGVFYGEFVGTFSGPISGDIYTTSATLVGTEAIFDRTDGITYSLDLSTLSGGGSGSVGPTGATGPQGYRAVMNLSYESSSLTIGIGTITLPIGVPINNLGWQQGTRVRVWHSDTEYMEGQITTVITNPQTAGINVNIDYVVGSGSFGEWYVGIAGDVGASATAGATPSLAEVLAIGNTTENNDIVLSNSPITGTSDSIRAFGNAFADAKFSFEDYGSGGYAPTMRTDVLYRQNYVSVGDQQTYIHNSYADAGTDAYSQIKVEPLSLELRADDLAVAQGATINLSPYQIDTAVTTGINYTQITQGQTNIQSIVDSGYSATGSSRFDMFYNETVAKTDCIIDGGIGTLSSGQRTYQDGAGTIGSEITTSNITQGFYANIYNWFDPSTAAVENIFSITAANPYGSSYITNITQRKDEIKVQGNVGTFRGIEYVDDYSAEFTANSLVTKDWVINNQATSLTDTVCNRTDEIFVDASGGEYECNPYIYPTISYTTIRSAMSGATAAIYVDPDTIRLNVVEIPGSYESEVTITDEVLTMYGGRSDVNNQTSWGIELGTEVRRYRYEHPSAPWGDVDKFEEKRLVLHQKFTNESGVPGQLDLYYENFVQDAINDFEIDFYIMNNEVQVSNKRYMTKSYKRRVYYNTSNQPTILIPDETKQGDTLNPLYDSWSITTVDTVYGTKYRLDYTLDSSYDYSVTIVVKQTAKKY
jgi:hypothetical protein